MQIFKATEAWQQGKEQKQVGLKGISGVGILVAELPVSTGREKMFVAFI